MSTPNLREQVQLLARTYNISPQHTKGQNFLINAEVIDRTIKAAGIQPGETVIEVGPGFGILTEALVANASKVISVELDERLYQFLQAKFFDTPAVQFIRDDVMALDFEKITEGKAYRVVANLPYNITSTFLKKVLTNLHKPVGVTLLLQKEVVERICAKPGKMSLLSLSVQLYATPTYIVTVPKTDFWPSPAIASAIVSINDFLDVKALTARLNGVSEEVFWRVAHMGFSAKRKQLHNNLAAGLHVSSDQAKEIIVSAHIDPAIRAQDLSIDEWISLAKSVDLYSGKSA